MKIPPVGLLSSLPGLVALAEELGYALAVHGSLKRDYDLIAVAWTHAAKSPEELINSLCAATGGYTINDSSADPYDFTRRSPEPKPHGRLAWTIYYDNSPVKIDISVIPPEADSVIKLMDRLEKMIAESAA